MTPLLADDQATTKTKSLLGVAAVLFVLVFAVFGRTLTITHWVSDDISLISQNPAVFCGLDVDTRQLAQAWWHSFEGLFIPVTYNFWWLVSLPTRLLDESIHPLSFHLANLLVHGLNGLLVFCIIRRFTRPLPALAGAAIFVVHPIQSEAVSWASAMKDLLSSLLLLTSVLFYLKTEEGKEKRARYTLALIAAWFATMAKPGAIVIGPCLIVIEWLRGTATPKQVALKVLPFFLVAIPAVWMTFASQPTLEVWAPPITLRPWVASYSIVHYLKAVIYPVGLTPDSGIQPLWIVLSGAGIAATLALAGLLGAILFLPRQHRKVAVCSLLLMVIGVAPLLGFTPFAFQMYSTVSDRYFYLSMLGVALLVGHVVSASKSSLPLLATAAVIAVLSAISFVQAGHWQSNDTVVARAMVTTPNTRVYLDRSKTDDERYADASRILLLDPMSEYGCSTMMRVCLNRGDKAIAVIYEQRLLERKIMYGYDSRQLAQECTYLVRHLIEVERYERVNRYAEIANQLQPNLTEVVQMNARLVELRASGVL